MKVLIVAVLVALIVCVSGDTCSTTADCTSHGHTHCGGGSHVACVHHLVLGQCECTTGTTGQTCNTKADCADCSNGRNKHCVDGECHCSRF
ncbi:integrin beta-5-like [Mercenaria mercenaria]|uniref:integrin beta-5-like n=1 Tax=Mercenaria mercenaria TaxID=6596 RepID=UPI001E1D6053|nr:integrin beta-5-like [Mercenaria mercenaria]